jgi:hypothetical protein
VAEEEQMIRSIARRQGRNLKSFDLTSISPTIGAIEGGTPITLTGLGFPADPIVTIDNVPATNAVRVSSTSITAVTPAGTFGNKNVTLLSNGEVSTLASAFDYGVFILDTLTATAAYSTRQVRNAYTGFCIRVRRSNDNVELNIGFTVSGQLDTAALLDHCGANSGFVTRWYDQSGNGLHLVQDTTTSQPRIVNAGVLETLGGVPAIVFDATDDRLEIGTWGDLSQPYTQNGVIRTATSYPGFPAMVGPSNDSTYTNAVTYIETNFRTIGPFTDTNGPRLPVTTTERLVFTSSFDGNNTNFAKNGVVTANGWVGGGTLSGVRLAGPGVTYQEITIFGNVLSVANRQMLEANQIAYFGVPSLPWSGVNLLAGVNNYVSVAANGTTWVAVADSTNQAARSTDNGVTWSVVTMTANRIWEDTAANGTTWVAVAFEADANRSTDNGASWSNVSLPLFAAWRAVAANGTTWVAVGTNISQCIRSTDDGANWVTVNLPANRFWFNVTANGTTWVALAGNGTDQSARSTDNGASWTAITLPASRDWRGLAVNGTTWVAVATGNTNQAARSTDNGATWSAITLPSARNWRSVAAIGTTWIAVAESNGNEAALSVDNGVTWSSVALPSARNRRAVAANATTFVTVPYGNTDAARAVVS